MSISIKESLNKLKTKAKESIEKEKLLRAKEKIMYKNAKAAEEKNQEAIRKAKALEREADRLEAARERGIKAALPGHKKEQAKEVAKKSASEILSFLRKHVEIAPKRTRRPSKRKMKHKSIKSKRVKRRRY